MDLTLWWVCQISINFGTLWNIGTFTWGVRNIWSTFCRPRADQSVSGTASCFYNPKHQWHMGRFRIKISYMSWLIYPYGKYLRIYVFYIKQLAVFILSWPYFYHSGVRHQRVIYFGIHKSWHAAPPSSILTTYYRQIIKLVWFRVGTQYPVPVRPIPFMR